MTVAASRITPARPNAPVRGTQSFVGVMAEVWKRPLLTVFEVAWRWMFWGAFLGALALRWWPLVSPIVAAVQASGWSSIGYLRSTYIGLSVQSGGDALRPLALSCMAAVLVWIALSAWAKGVLLKRLNPEAKVAFGALLSFSAARVVCLLAVLFLWVRCVVTLTQRMVIAPQAVGREPAFVPYAALLICGTLFLFVFWMAASYVFQLLPIYAVARGVGGRNCLKAALQGGVLRSKLVEINLVIGIVKIALLVLALVFSACPLPFSSVETQVFLTWWWIGVGAWYALASDYFHVVRTVAFYRLWRVYESPSLLRAAEAKPAS